jgi:hypothetical protein
LQDPRHVGVFRPVGDIDRSVVDQSKARNDKNKTAVGVFDQSAQWTQLRRSSCCRDSWEGLWLSQAGASPAAVDPNGEIQSFMGRRCQAHWHVESPVMVEGARAG